MSSKGPGKESITVQWNKEVPLMEQEELRLWIDQMPISDELKNNLKKQYGLVEESKKATPNDKKTISWN